MEPKEFVAVAGDAFIQVRSAGRALRRAEGSMNIPFGKEKREKAGAEIEKAKELPEDALEKLDRLEQAVEGD